MTSIKYTLIVLGLSFIFGGLFFFGYLFSSLDNKNILLLILFGILVTGYFLLVLYLTRSVIIYSQNNFVAQLSKSLLIEESSKINQQEIIRTISRNVDLVEQRLKPLELLIANLSLGILIFAKNKTLIEANLVARKMLGVSPRLENYQENIANAFTKYELDDHLEKIISGYKVETFEVKIESEPKTWLQIEMKLVLDRRLSEYIITIMQDITREKNFEQMRKDFVANVSHQLRTPITSINGFIETLLQNKMYNDEQGQHFLQIIYQQGNKLTGIIDDLLTLSALELSEVNKKITVDNVRVVTVIESAVNLCEQKAKINNIPLFIECNSDIMCRLNSRLIEQAIINLIENAINYSYDGCEVKIRVNNNINFVVISVIDSGIGIPDDQLERVFERFYQINSVNKIRKSGSGLGLSIAKHIAEVHHGYLTVESVLEKGSTFTLLLPK